MGTGGVLLGVTVALKQAYHQGVRIIAVDPAESRVLSGSQPGCHQIYEIGEGLIPRLVQGNRDLITGVITVQSCDAIAMCKALARKHGVLVRGELWCQHGSNEDYLRAEVCKIEKRRKVIKDIDI